MIQREKVTQPLVTVEPQYETPTTNEKSVKLSLSLAIIARGGVSVEGNVAMQQTQTMRPVPPRASRSTQTAETVQLEQTVQVETQTYPVKQLPGYKPRGAHWSVPGGTTFLLTLIVLIIASAYIVPLYIQTYNHWTYGESHISQLDATINNRHDHFIAQTLHNRVIVIDLRDSNAAKAQVFVSPQPATIDHAVVTLQEMYIDGHEAIVVQVENQQVASILYSTGDTFEWDVPPTKR